jgi:UDP-sugar pyrophosphorylase
MAAKKKRTKKAKDPNKPRLKPVCKFHLQGRCNKGDQCTFLHENTTGKGTNNNNGTVQEPELPPALAKALPVLSESQRQLAVQLCKVNQSHLFQHDDATKTQQLLTKLQAVDSSHHSGLLGYLSNARALLSDSSKGVNPLEGWVPSVPVGESFSLVDTVSSTASSGTASTISVPPSGFTDSSLTSTSSKFAEFLESEQRGLQEVGKTGFVLVAGGLGERLGYNDIKIGLPVEIGTMCKYVEFYVEMILGYQRR